MLRKLKKIARHYVNLLVYKTDHYADMKIIDEEFGEIHKKCSKYTETSKTSLYAAYKATKYMVQNNIPGDIVECGVWKGGSAMTMLYTLLEMKETHRKIYLYDTYAGMAEPTKEDIAIPNGNPASIKWNKNKFKDWGYISVEEARSNILSTGYPEQNIIFVKGKVEDTIPKTIPERISLLRLDTDWYESTKHELNHLYPLLSINGVIIADDYGYWAGSKKAVDEYFLDKPILLNRIDQTGRIGIKVNN